MPLSRFCSLLLCSLATAAVSVSLAATPVRADCGAKVPVLSLYQADYSTRYNGLSVKTHRSLSQDKSGAYVAEGHTAMLFVGIEERSVFTLSGNQVVPSHYEYQRTGLGDSKDFSLDYDRQASQLIIHTAKASKPQPLPEHLQDPLSHQEQMRLDLLCESASADTTADQVLTYAVAKKKGIRPYRYSAIGYVDLDTPLGKLHTLQLEKVDDDGKRKTRIWLAPDWDYLLVKLTYAEGDDTAESMVITRASLADKKVTGL